MNKKIGFIGMGNMGQAILKGMLNAGFAEPSDVIASRRNEKVLEGLRAKWGILTTTDNVTVAKAADILFLTIKPHLYDAIIKEVRESVRPDAVVVAVAAGVTLEDVMESFGAPVKIARAMPNTPAAVGEAMIGLCFGEGVAREEQEELVALFSSLGKVEVVEERLFDAVIGVSGSSPAMLYMVIEAMADAVVRAGMPRAQAYNFAAQAMLGTAKMVLESGRHPGELKDAVCSPGGTTIEMVVKAEENGLRSAVMQSVEAAIAKSVEMNGK
ncbi:pyrroline-5-carboxylate reductase [Jeotgalibaca sp. A122]|uniref:pyrroline-5-carboxylate reductase n=1 Tax=Jeotgalibaca sp. A122 TaxID=3457322 RepID=UPI003FD2D24E